MFDSKSYIESIRKVSNGYIVNYYEPYQKEEIIFVKLIDMLNWLANFYGIKDREGGEYVVGLNFKEWDEA